MEVEIVFIEDNDDMKDDVLEQMDQLIKKRNINELMVVRRVELKNKLSFLNKLSKIELR